MSNLNHYAPLRFITAGSVDDGKSTLIGRLLYDSKTLLTDQLNHLAKTKNGSEVIDFSVLTDGLEAEREQGITIDVAYRYFSTANRKFIIADTPGHEQYTRNMVTGASTAHAAVVLIDATQIDFSAEPVSLLAQTKRHSAILKHLGTPHILVAVNKMDLLDFNQAKFDAIVSAYKRLAEQLGLADVRFIPISALNGDNIVHDSDNTPWYTGGALLSILEALEIGDDTSEAAADLHLPVQLVLRADGDKADDFRGYQGRIESGSVHIADKVRIEPAGRTTSITEIYGVDGRVDSASAGEQVTVRISDDIDISRGDSIVAAASASLPTKELTATLCWFDERELNPARKYLLKHTTQTVFAKVASIEHVWDVHTLTNFSDKQTLAMNDLGEVKIRLQKPIIATSYAANKATGSFILIDEVTHHTVAGGIILDKAADDDW